LSCFSIFLCNVSFIIGNSVQAWLMKAYSGIVRRYPKISLSEERRLISKAQKGSRKSKDELVLRIPLNLFLTFGNESMDL